MLNQTQNLKKPFIFFVFILTLIALTRFTSLKPNWGSFEMRTNPTSTITVTGKAEKQELNQIAYFTAGVESIEESKEAALQKSTEAMNQLIDRVKAFGIKAEDIQSQNVNVYQETEYIKEDRAVNNLMYPEPDRGEARKGDWRANNSVSITLREVERAEDLLAILNDSGANAITGPNFSLEDADQITDELLVEAVSNARAKAEKIAAANHQKVGKIITLSEDGVYPLYESYRSSVPMASGAMAMDAKLEPGSSTTLKTVSVTFELN